MSALQKLPQLTIQKSISMNWKTPKDFHNSYQLKIYCEASLFLANLFVKKKKNKGSEMMLQMIKFSLLKQHFVKL